MRIVEQRDRPISFDQLVEAFERGRTIHPVEAAAHRDQAKPAESRIQAIRTSLPELHVGREPERRGGCGGEHPGLGVETDDVTGEIAESDRELPGAAAEIEHAVRVTKPDSLGDAADQGRRVRHPAGTVVARGSDEPVRVKRQRIGGHGR